ncbi:MAG: transcription antitermination factor NusB [bacterium]|nr:transcription antitermination factor NusB [bacterium]
MEETRSGARETAMKILYQISILEKAEASYDLDEIFSKVEGRNKEFIESIVNEVILKKEELDKKANTYLINWEVNRLNKVDQAIFEIAVYELLYTDTPKKVVIDEAINLSKKYSEDAVVKMLNGVLDKIYHEEDKDAE